MMSSPCASVPAPRQSHDATSSDDSAHFNAAEISTPQLGKSDVTKTKSSARPHVGRGPRGKRGDMRETIRRIAEEEFIANGYDGTTTRHIAARANCDPAMVNYYFDSKQRLFRECFDLPIDPAGQICEILAPDLTNAAERLMTFALALYDQTFTADKVQGLMRAMMTDLTTKQRFRSYVHSSIIPDTTDFIHQHVCGTDAPPLSPATRTAIAREIECVMSTLYGVATMRYIVQLEPLASMSEQALIDEFAPIVQRRLDTVVKLVRSPRRR